MTIARAHEQLKAGDRTAALAGVKLAWRITRDPIVARLAAVLERELHPADPIRGSTITAKHAAWLALEAERTPTDTTTLLAGLAIGRSALAGERLAKIHDWDPDPAVATALVGLIDTAPYPSQDKLVLWDQVLAILIALGDPRTVPELQRLAAKPWPGSARMGKLMKQRLSRAAATIAALHWPALDPDEADARDGLAKLLLQPTAPAIRTEAELLAEIYDRPADHELRKVYGDVLMQRDDPRGVLIALQCLPELDAANAKVEASLLRKHRKDWLGPLAAIATDVTFERGFVATLSYVGRYASQITALTGAREWATVRALRLVEPRTKNGVVELITHDVMRSLRDVRCLRHADAVALAGLPVAQRYEGLGFSVHNESQPTFPLARFRKLRELEITSRAYQLPVLAWLQNDPVIERLEVLEVENGDRTFASWLACAQAKGKQLRRLVIRPTADSASGAVRFTVERGPTGRLDALTMTVGDDHTRYPDVAVQSLSDALTALPAQLSSVAVTPPPWLATRAADIEARVFDTRRRLGL